MGSMDGKSALVTGGTSGIGKAIATGLAREGAMVTITGRDKARAEAALRDIQAKSQGAKVEWLNVDLASQASMRAACAEWLARHDKLDVLVNAAGVFVKERKESPEGIELTLATNVLSYYAMSNLLLPALKKAAPSRIVNVTSRYGGAKVDFDDLQMKRRAYSYLKATPPTMLGRVLITQAMAERLQGTGVVVNALHPGLVANTKLLEETGGLFRWMTNTFGGTPEKGADTALWLATAPETARLTGKMFSGRKEMKTPGQGSDAAARTRMWDEAATLTKLA